MKLPFVIKTAEGWGFGGREDAVACPSPNRKKSDVFQRESRDGRVGFCYGWSILLRDASK